MEEINLLISETEIEIENNTSNIKLLSSNIYNLVVLKKSAGFEDIYVDIKRFITAYLDSILLEDYEYDNINIAKIFEIIEFLPENKRYAMLNYFNSQLKSKHLEIDKNKFIYKKNLYDIQYILYSESLLKYLKVLPNILNLKLRYLIFFIVLSFVLLNLIMLPAPFREMEIFDITFHNYFESNFLNHISNCFSILLDIDNDTKIKPLNFVAFISLCFMKIIYILLFVNYIYLRILDRIF